MTVIKFKQVDVFTTKPFKGNPVAVIMDGKDLSDRQMLAIASWTNLSETTFVLPAENKCADYRVRIFTPAGELPFAGHPTIGTAFALLEAGVISPVNGELIQECAAGLIPLRVAASASAAISIAFRLPQPSITPLTEAEVQCLDAILGCPVERSQSPVVVDVGARWIVIKTTDAEAVIRTRPDFTRLAQHDKSMKVTGVCIYGEHPGADVMHIEVRSFAPSCGVNEDPVCGSGNGSVAAFLQYYGNLPATGKIESSQGQVVGRDGKLELSICDEAIFVGGYATTRIAGDINC